MRVNNQDTFLAQWIIGNLSDNDLKNKIPSEEFEVYFTLRNCVNNMQSPPVDVEQSYYEFKKRLNEKVYFVEPRFNYLKITSIAASLLLLFSIAFYHFGLFGQNIVTTSSNYEQIKIGDDVSVLLYKSSSITQSAPLYNHDRVDLKYGKAYFKVKKGTSFLIETQYGTVKVLGTKFTVDLNNKILDVKCFEGRVKVDYNGVSYYVNAGEEFNSIIRRTKKSNKLLDQDGVSPYKKFVSVKLIDVLRFIEMNYEVNIKIPEDIKNQNFTGTLPVNDLGLSLNLIANSFDLNFVILGDKVVFK